MKQRISIISRFNCTGFFRTQLLKKQNPFWSNNFITGDSFGKTSSPYSCQGKTLTWIGGLAWVLAWHEFRFVKIDDDVIVNPFILSSYLDLRKQRKKESSLQQDKLPQLVFLKLSPVIKLLLQNGFCFFNFSYHFVTILCETCELKLWFSFIF